MAQCSHALDSVDRFSGAAVALAILRLAIYVVGTSTFFDDASLLGQRLKTLTEAQPNPLYWLGVFVVGLVGLALLFLPHSFRTVWSHGKPPPIGGAFVRANPGSTKVVVRTEGSDILGFGSLVDSHAAETIVSVKWSKIKAVRPVE